jgi:hypothetical protein
MLVMVPEHQCSILMPKMYQVSVFSQEPSGILITSEVHGPISVHADIWRITDPEEVIVFILPTFDYCHTQHKLKF